VQWRRRYLGLESVHLAEDLVGERLGDASEAHGDALD
jgi:hypothetical protein